MKEDKIEVGNRVKLKKISLKIGEKYCKRYFGGAVDIDLDLIENNYEGLVVEKIMTPIGLAIIVEFERKSRNIGHRPKWHFNINEIKYIIGEKGAKL